MKMQLVGGEGDVREVEIEEDEFDKDEKFGLPARNVARLYNGLSRGEINCSFEDAVERHELIEGMYKENGVALTYYSRRK